MTDLSILESSIEFLDSDDLLQQTINETNTIFKKIYKILEFLELDHHMDLATLIMQINMLDYTRCIIISKNYLDDSILLWDRNSDDFLELLFEYLVELAKDRTDTRKVESLQLIIGELICIGNSGHAGSASKIQEKLKQILSIYYSGEKVSLLLLSPSVLESSELDASELVYDLLEARHIFNNINERLSISNLVALNGKLNVKRDFLTKFIDIN